MELMGIKTFYSDSNGNTVSNPRYLERSMRKLIREQRRLSRKRKDSHNREKQRIKVARVHEKVTIRKHNDAGARKPNHLHRRFECERNDPEP